jgi:predicted small metal-binding protein
MESTKGKMNMHFETIANNQSCNEILRAKKIHATRAHGASSRFS